jgi:deoxyribose-phosphate aldolase
MAPGPGLAALLDHWLVKPDLTSAQVLEGLQLARRYGVASAIVRPCDTDLAVRTLAGSGVKPASAVGFPHGWQNTATKLYELRDVLRRGARELDMTIALPNLLSREFQHVQTELMQASEACHREGALLAVTLQTEYLTDDLKIIACGCCERAEVDFVSASTLADVQLLRQHLPEEIALKGSADTLEQVLALRDAGCARIATSSTVAILDSATQVPSEPRP